MPGILCKEPGCGCTLPECVAYDGYCGEHRKDLSPYENYESKRMEIALPDERPDGRHGFGGWD